MSNSKALEIYTYVAIPDSPFYYTPMANTDRPIAADYLNIVRAGCLEVDRTRQLNGVFINDCVQTLEIGGYEINDDSNTRNYPGSLLEKAEKKVSVRKQYLEQDWQDYMDNTQKHWGR